MSTLQYAHSAHLSQIVVHCTYLHFPAQCHPSCNEPSFCIHWGTIAINSIKLFYILRYLFHGHCNQTCIYSLPPSETFSTLKSSISLEWQKYFDKSYQLFSITRNLRGLLIMRMMKSGSWVLIGKLSQCKWWWWWSYADEDEIEEPE